MSYEDEDGLGSDGLGDTRREVGGLVEGGTSAHDLALRNSNMETSDRRRRGA